MDEKLCKLCFSGSQRRCRREMERTVKGAKEVKQELQEARRRVKEVEEDKHKSDIMKTIKTSFYKSPVGTRSKRFIWHSLFDIYYIF